MNGKNGVDGPNVQPLAAKDQNLELARAATRLSEATERVPGTPQSLQIACSLIVQVIHILPSFKPYQALPFNVMPSSSTNKTIVSGISLPSRQDITIYLSSLQVLLLNGRNGAPGPIARSPAARE